MNDVTLNGYPNTDRDKKTFLHMKFTIHILYLDAKSHGYIIVWML